MAKATIHPPNRPVLREPRARALLLPLGIFAMPAAHAAHICGDNVGAPERLEHPVCPSPYMGFFTIRTSGSVNFGEFEFRRI